MLCSAVFHADHDGALSDVIRAKKVFEKCIMLSAIGVQLVTNLNSSIRSSKIQVISAMIRGIN